MGQTYTVEQGDCLASIAAQSGFRDPAKIFNDAGNEELRKQRPNWNVLDEGDTVFVPDPQPRVQQGATDASHRFELRKPKVKLVLKLLSDRDEVLAGAKCQLVIDGEAQSLTSDGGGFIRVPIDPELMSAELYVWADDAGAEIPSDAFLLELGGLPPTDSDSGVQARLVNLGFFCGEVDGEVGKRTQYAIKAFQLKKNLDITGDLDDQVRSQLEQAHGC